MAQIDRLTTLLCICLMFAETWSIDASFTNPKIGVVEKTSLFERGVDLSVLDDVITRLSREDHKTMEQHARVLLAGRNTTVIMGDITFIINSN
ncbi:unnamed protein product [Candidula unifasciata]|uniref:Uncharacterized protein n=1 Tax=Candidula unifasciata TaxID=100452 RepID=A0A8S3YWR0_9EUPU|nr:unnamed protein product [Candidula unifasciata]